MTTERPELTRQILLDYFERGATSRSGWQVGMEVEKMGRNAADGRPIAYDADGPSVRKCLEFIQAHRGGDPVFEAESLIGLDAPWGSISLEPGGQVEWSSRPHDTLVSLEHSLLEHLKTMREVEASLGVAWLDEATDPVHGVDEMPWMPKARYKIMRRFLGERGRLAHRMMTQTASIQCAFDYADAEDWRRKFKAAATLSPLATALFANSSRIDGAESGYRSYRQVIWRETDIERCGLPSVVFEPDFSMEHWLDWVLDVPCIFRHRARGLVPAGAVPFRSLMALGGCDAVKPEDWEIHASTIFTDVRSYTYIEVRSADLLADEDCMAVPCLWTGLLYDESSLGAALELGAPFDDPAGWSLAMGQAARHGLDGQVDGHSLREIARRLIATAIAGLNRGAACAGDPGGPVRHLERLAARHGLDL